MRNVWWQLVPLSRPFMDVLRPFTSRKWFVPLHGWSGRVVCGNVSMMPPILNNCWRYWQRIAHGGIITIAPAMLHIQWAVSSEDLVSLSTFFGSQTAKHWFAIRVKLLSPFSEGRWTNRFRSFLFASSLLTWSAFIRTYCFIAVKFMKLSAKCLVNVV
jgi:hypothetical protein